MFVSICALLTVNGCCFMWDRSCTARIFISQANFASLYILREIFIVQHFAWNLFDFSRLVSLFAHSAELVSRNEINNKNRIKPWIPALCLKLLPGLMLIGIYANARIISKKQKYVQLQNPMKIARISNVYFVHPVFSFSIFHNHLRLWESMEIFPTICSVCFSIFDFCTNIGVDFFCVSTALGH